MPFRKLIRIIAGAGCCFLSACASGPTVQPQINYMVVTNRYDRALSILEKHQKDYGERNQLMYLLDQGLVLHYAGKYRQSNEVFEKAKKEYDKLLTTSVSKEALSWVWNDYALPYRGEDFERVMINVFEALNYAALEDWENALVEARDVDSTLRAINLQYQPDQRNVYKEDAFARMLMGMMYEASGSSSDLDDAYISYQKALEIYQTKFQKLFHVQPPEILKENLLSLAAVIDRPGFRGFKEKFPDTPLVGFDRRQKNAEIYLVAYEGFGPVKADANFIVPVNGQLYKFAFSRYKERYQSRGKKTFTAREATAQYSEPVELVQDINKLAETTLESRRLRLTAKTLVRMAGKGLLVKEQTDRLQKNYGDTTGGVAKVVGNLIYLYSEQADLRSWETLPANIGMARLVVQPGLYNLFFDETEIGQVRVKAGEKKFVFYRTLK